MVNVRIGVTLGWVAGAGLGLLTWVGCATSTEFYYEGPGAPSDRSTGTVPEGVLGVCRLPNTARPVIMDEKLWEHARTCTPQTPARFLRLGYTPISATNEADAIKEQDRFLTALKEGQKEGGNNQLVSLLRNLHERGLRDSALHNRVSRQTTKDGICDYTYLLNTMAAQREKLAKKDDKCTAQAYDTSVKNEVCLFDTTHAEVVWLTSSWPCVTHTGALGDSTSCYRMCSYDDYCAKHVSCASPDIDLLLCAMGVCLPEQRAGNL